MLLKVNGKYFHTAIILFVCHWVFSQCPQGDIFLFTQEEVDNMVSAFPNCETVTGDLIIGDDINDISGINKVKRIEGSLVVMGTNITSISNFATLNFIFGDFYIEHNANLESIEGINLLTHIGGDLVISTENGGLRSISGFNSLETIGGNFTVSDNQDLVSFTGFPVLTNAEGWFTISDNARLPGIPNFNQLKLISNDFAILNNDALPQINGFNQLEEIKRSFTIKDNDLLESVNGFGRLSEVIFEMELNGVNLSGIPDFNALVTIGGGLNVNHTALTGITGFNNVNVIGDVNPALGYLFISDNKDLTAINGFDNLQKLEGEFRVDSNNALLSLGGFSDLVQVGALNIFLNASLPDLNGLGSLNIVGGLNTNGIYINGNPALMDCSAICNLLQNGDILGRVDIADNPSKCSSDIEIIEACHPDFDNDGIVNVDDLDDDNDGILDVVEQNGAIDRDTDSDGFPDHRDLDSDGDGCFDVIEAGFTDDDGNGTLGTMPDTVDSDGLIIGELTGYTTPLDADIDGVPDFQQNDTKGAGTDGSLTICTYDLPVDLFDSLGDEADSGGYWIPELSSGTGVFDPMVDAPGVYTYIVSNGVCGDESAMVTVNLRTSDDNTEAYSTLELCFKSGPVNLFDHLEGASEPGGKWTPELVSGTDIFDPSMDVPGLYAYEVSTGELCGRHISRILINVTGLNLITNYTIKTSSYTDSNFIEVIVDSDLQLEYSLDGIQYQESNRFENLESGSYRVFARERDGCGYLEDTVTILDFPKFFTPNGDGINDTWELEGTETIAVYIYDRYGKLLKFLQAGNGAWDGTFKGVNLPVDDYWFKAVFPDNKVRIGNFTLKR
ncbi:T9SS type B sorting domain-containing protein [Seonamhaeicola sp.]|uniref:T9SS type B sorting domain-containing protein n=1 Tax=Seonamhaeicola sp. TaxID=1912245 RepID=UPI0026034643|nr:T9SS type B sorting domain-containing protein [Seonamhaeicola sp.]